MDARDVDGRPPLYAAVNNSNPDIIKTLLDAGADVDARDKSGWTSLMYAVAYSRKSDIIKALIDAGADVNARDDVGGLSLLMISAFAR